MGASGRRGAAVLLACASLLSASCASRGGGEGLSGGSDRRGSLPVLVSDSHAESFYWLAERLDWSASALLVNVDRHHDLMPVAGQESFRKRLAEPGSRKPCLAELRGYGAVQCYAWILPLMPRPIGRALWVIGGPEGERAGARARSDAAIRAATGPDYARFKPLLDLTRTLELGEFLEGGLPPEAGKPLVLSVDLDAFSGQGSPRREAELCRRAFRRALSLSDLEALTVAVSRDYLASDGESWALLEAALDVLEADGRTAIESVLDRPADEERSTWADEQRRLLGSVPAFSLEGAPPSLRALLERTSPSRSPGP